MTASISIAKPRSKRTQKGLILTGATGKHARHDGRHETYEHELTRRPVPDADFDIAHSLCGDEFDEFDLAPYWGQSRRPQRSVWTSESSDFACRRPTRRRRVRNVRRAERAKIVKLVESQDIGLPLYDEAGRPIVYKVDDMMAHCSRLRRR